MSTHLPRVAGSPRGGGKRSPTGHAGEPRRPAFAGPSATDRRRWIPATAKALRGRPARAAEVVALGDLEPELREAARGRPVLPALREGLPRPSRGRDLGREGRGAGTGLRPMVNARIYDNTVEALLEAIRKSHEDVRTFAVVGHNPSIRELAGVLDDGQGSPAARRDLGARFRTGGVAVFVLPTPFAAIAPGGQR